MSSALTRTSLEPRSLDAAYEFCSKMTESSMVPRGMVPADLMILLMAGQELGMGFARACRSIHVVQGRAVLDATAMVGLVMAHPACEYFIMLESTAERAVYETQRTGHPQPTRYEYTVAEARTAGLAGKGTWKAHPRAMLRARCASALARIVYPDVVAGIYEQDEGREIAGEYRQPAPARREPSERENRLRLERDERLDMHDAKVAGRKVARKEKAQQKRSALESPKPEQVEDAEVVDERAAPAGPTVHTAQALEGVAMMRAAEESAQGRKTWTRDEKGAPPMSALTDALKWRGIPQAMWDAYVADMLDEDTESDPPMTDAALASCWRSFDDWRESVIDSDRTVDRLRWWAQALGSAWSMFMRSLNAPSGIGPGDVPSDKHDAVLGRVEQWVSEQGITLDNER